MNQKKINRYFYLQVLHIGFHGKKESSEEETSQEKSGKEEGAEEETTTLCRQDQGRQEM